MTYTVYNGTFIGAGNAFTMAAGDSLQTLPLSILASTNGDGISATGNVAIEVGGQVGGDLNGILDVLSAGQSSFVYVEKTGNVFSAPFEQGINIVGNVAGAQHTIFNAGSVQSIGSDGFGIEVQQAGLIVNEAGGSISAGDGIVDFDSTATDVNNIVNLGSLVGSTFAFEGNNANEELFSNEGTVSGSISMGGNAADVLYNTGAMNASAASGFSVGDSFVGNYGTMSETVASSSAVNMIVFGNGAGDSLYNGGTIVETQSGGSNPSSSAVLFGSGAGDRLGNGSGGTIDGNVKFGSGNGQYVNNQGVINGNVYLGAGVADAYYGASGHLVGTGSLFMGNGGDTAVMGNGTENVQAGLGFDNMTMSNGGLTYVYEPLSEQQNGGWDYVNNFQTANGATHQGTYLILSASLSGSTTFSAFNGGTLVTMALGSGHFSYIDLPGAAVSTVQAQSQFVL
jgi:hypothetical protein